MASYRTLDVFTPTKPARLAFIERETLNDKLVSALRTPGKQLVVYGHSGSGKTTLLANKLTQLYEYHIVSRCMKGMTFEQLVLDAFDQLAPFYTSERTSSKQSSISPALSAEYAGLKLQLAAQTTQTNAGKEQRLLPPQLTPQALARFIGASHGCWVLEDFHKTDDADKIKVSQLMKVFMDMADEYGDLKIIALGAVDTAREVVQYDPEMRNRVAEIHVPLMTDAEIAAIVQKGQGLLNVQFSPAVLEDVVRFSNGLAAACHHLCLNTCQAAEIDQSAPALVKLGEQEFGLALKQYLDEASDTLKAAFDKAFRRERTRRFDNAKIIVRALVKCDQEGGTRAELYQKIKQREPKYPQPNLTSYLKKLATSERGALIRYDGVSGRYSFADPLFRAFALAYFEEHIDARSRIDVVDLEVVIQTLRVSLSKDWESRKHFLVSSYQRRETSAKKAEPDCGPQ